MKFVFLDRDGVINCFPGHGNYVTTVKGFRFLPGARKAIRSLTQAGFAVFVVSNQACVSKGLLSKKVLDRITVKLMKGVIEAGGMIHGVYYSTSMSGENCEYRKPNRGLIDHSFRLTNASRETQRRSFFVGDARTDIQAGHSAGCKTILVLSGKESRKTLDDNWVVQPDFIVKDLSEASRVILQQR